MKHLLIASVLIGIVACGVPASKGASDHHCADLVAQAMTTKGAVPGLWACLTPDLQRSINASGNGSATNPDGVLSIGVALTTSYIGGNADFANYELVLNPETAAQAGTKWVELILWLHHGKVANVGVPRPAF